MDKPDPSNKPLRNRSKKRERAELAAEQKDQSTSYNFSHSLSPTNRPVRKNPSPTVGEKLKVPQLANIGKSQKTEALPKKKKTSVLGRGSFHPPSVASTSTNNQIPVDTSNMREAQQDFERRKEALRNPTRSKGFPTSSLSPARNRAVPGQADNKGPVKNRSYSQNPDFKIGLQHPKPQGIGARRKEASATATAAAAAVTSKIRAREEQKNRSRALVRTPAQDDVLQKFSDFIGSTGEFTKHQTKGYGIVFNEQFYETGQKPEDLPNNLFLLKEVRDLQKEKFSLQIGVVSPDDTTARNKKQITIPDPELGVPFGGETYRRRNSGEEEEVNEEPGTSGQGSSRTGRGSTKRKHNQTKN